MAEKKKSRLGLKVGVAALAATTVGGFEGLRLNAYPDPATMGHPWTICYGHTGDVRKGDRKDIEQCKSLLVRDLEKYALGVESCIRTPMGDARYVAFVSLAYNIGPGGFCKSSVARYQNAGNYRAACDAMMNFNKARVAGILITFPGLTRRREAERKLCIQDHA